MKFKIIMTLLAFLNCTKLKRNTNKCSNERSDEGSYSSNENNPLEESTYCYCHQQDDLISTCSNKSDFSNKETNLHSKAYPAYISNIENMYDLYSYNTNTCSLSDNHEYSSKQPLEIYIITMPLGQKDNLSFYMKNVLNTLEYFDSDIKENDKAYEILEYIYESLKDKPRQMAIFIACSFFNTEFFSKFINESDSRYCARGLMMLEGKEEYSALTKISGVNFLESPEFLEEISRCSVYNTIKVWTRFMFDATMSLKEIYHAFVIDKCDNSDIVPGYKHFKSLVNKLMGIINNE